MITSRTQRWRQGRATYRPATEPIRTSDYEVVALEGKGSDTTAKGFVQAHHYARTLSPARFRFGLYRAGALVGVAVFGVPANDDALRVLPGTPRESIELGRFVLLDDVPGNGETWFLGRAFELLRREGLVGVVSFSDPVPRRAGDGTVVFPGHLGTIYQAHNAVYLGRTKAEQKLLLPDGTLLHGRTVAKIRRGDRGARYAAALLERHGAEPLGAGPAGPWLERWLPRLTRPFYHPGNHKYVWTLFQSRRHFEQHLRRIGKAPQPYPKLKDAA